jgi:hypothetical protein
VFFLLLLLFLFLLVYTVSTLFAATITLAWDANMEPELRLHITTDADRTYRLGN